MISRAVMLSWMSALALVSNCLARNQPWVSASSTAFWYMPSPFCARGVSTTFAPSMRMSLRRSIEKLWPSLRRADSPFGADHCEPDAGVATGRLDHCLTRLELADALGRLDDVERESVLDRRGRVEEFSFDIDCPALNSEIVNPDRRSVADSFENTVEKATTT